MKKILLITLTALFCVAVSAQEAKKGSGKKATPTELAQKVTERFTQELGLSEDQAGQYQAIMLDRIIASAALADDSTLTKDQANSKRAGIVKKADAKVEKLFTPEQWEKYKESSKNKQVIPVGYFDKK